MTWDKALSWANLLRVAPFEAPNIVTDLVHHVGRLLVADGHDAPTDLSALLTTLDRIAANG